MTIFTDTTLNYPVNANTPIKRVRARRPPTTNDDSNFTLGDEWLDLSGLAWWKLVDLTNTSGALWVMMGGGATAITFVENSGSAVTAGGILNVLGGVGISTVGAGNTITINALGSVPTTFVEDAGSATPVGNILHIAGGAGITTAGAGSTVTISQSGTVATLYTEDTGSAIPAGNNLNIKGGTGIATSGAGSTVTIALTGAVATLYTENAGTATPSGNNLNILGAGGITTSGAGSTVTISPSGIIATSYVENAGTAVPAGGVLNVLGTGGITTSGAGNTITITGSSAIPLTFTEDAGTATPAANNLNIFGTASQGISTSGAGSTVTLTIANATTAQIGVSRLATNAEAIAGALTTNVVINPGSLNAKLGSQTLHGIAIGGGPTNAITWTAAPTNGQILIGSTGNPPVLNTLTAGAGITVTNNPGSITVAAPGAGVVFQQVRINTGNLIHCTSFINPDDTVPTVSQGNAVLSLTITPISATSTLFVEANTFAGTSQNSSATMTLFRDAGTNSLATTTAVTPTTNEQVNLVLRYFTTSGSVAPTTFAIRVGPDIGTLDVNGLGNNTRMFGGTANTMLTITEYST